MEQVKMDNKMVDFIFGEALKDATVEGAFKGKKAWIQKEIKEKEKNGKDWPVKHIIKEYLQFLLTECDSQEAHDEYFKTAAKAICDEIGNLRENVGPFAGTFRFGNAQKLINMCAKYFYTVSYCSPSLSFRFKFCHCPMDGEMIKRVWKERDRCSSISDYSFIEFCAGWGAMEFDGGLLPKRYRDFQAAIRLLAKEVKKENGESLSPIEYDFYMWKS